MLIKNYFLLQIKLLNRKFNDFGVPPLVVYLASPLVFIGLANSLFSKINFFEYIFISILLLLIIKLSEKKRNDFLRIIYRSIDYYKIRIIENGLIGLPFLMYLFYVKYVLLPLILIPIVVALSLVRFNIAFRFSIPTPFDKKPFEFTEGFRKTIYMFPILYFLTLMSIIVDNFNLGIVSLILVAFVCMGYYNKLEKEYFVWNFNLSGKDFLIYKMKMSIYCFAILSIPILIPLSLFFYKQIELIFLSFLICVIYLITVVLSKYSSYPRQISLTTGLMVTVCFLFPPALIFVIPMFFSKSITRLNTILR